jgi:ParB/RepB/Spo0J family partition protein
VSDTSVQQEGAVEPTALPTEVLKPNGWNPNRMTDEEFTELVEEVRHLGRLPKPVIVRNGYAGNAGEYLIVDGEHGWRAAKEVGLEEITCEVIEADDFEAMRQTYKRNQHGTHDRVALGQMFRRMMDERDMSRRQLAKEINVSEGTIRNALVFAEAAEMRRRWAGEKGATKDDWPFVQLTTKGARDYVQLPEGLRDRWLNGGAKPVSDPETWGMPSYGYLEQLDSYLKVMELSGIAKVFDRGGPWDKNAKLSYELMMWRANHSRVIGEDIDEYMRPVIEKRPVRPTAIEILDEIPMHDRKPLLTPEEWAKALEVVWEKSDRAYEVLAKFGDVAKLKAHDLGIPADDLDDPREALRKVEIEKDAPAFLRDAPLPLRTKHWLFKAADTYYDARKHINSSELTPEERVRAKQGAVRLLIKEHERYKVEVAAYEAHMEELKKLPPDQYMAAITAKMRGLDNGPKYPRGIPRVQDVWVANIKALRQEQEQAEQAAQQAELKKTFEDSQKVVEALVEKFSTAAPKVFGQEVGGKGASEVLRERLLAMPRAELLLLGAVMLRAPVTVWLEEVRREVEREPRDTNP